MTFRTFLMIFLLSQNVAHAGGEFVFSIFDKPIYKRNFVQAADPSLLDQALRYYALYPIFIGTVLADVIGASTNKKYLESRGHELLLEVEEAAVSKVHTALALMGVKNANKVPVYQFTKMSPNGIWGCTDGHEICLHKEYADLFTIYHEAAHYALEHSKRKSLQAAHIKMDCRPNLLSCGASAMAGILFSGMYFGGMGDRALDALAWFDIGSLILIAALAQGSREWHEPSENSIFSQEVEADRLAAETLIRNGNINVVQKKVFDRETMWLYAVLRMSQGQKPSALARLATMLSLNISEIPSKHEVADFRKKICAGEMSVEPLKKEFGAYAFKELACTAGALAGFYAAVEHAICQQEEERASGFQKLALKMQRFVHSRALPSDLSSIDMDKILHELKDRKFDQ